MRGGADAADRSKPTGPVSHRSRTSSARRGRCRVHMCRPIVERRFLMEPRNVDLKKAPEEPKAARKSRFQIVKLEERIAPHCSAHYNPQGKPVGNYSSRDCGHGGR